MARHQSPEINNLIHQLEPDQVASARQKAAEHIKACRAAGIPVEPEERILREALQCELAETGKPLPVFHVPDDYERRNYEQYRSGRERF